MSKKKVNKVKEFIKEHAAPIIVVGGSVIFTGVLCAIGVKRAKKEGKFIDIMTPNDKVVKASKLISNDNHNGSLLFALKDVKSDEISEVARQVMEVGEMDDTGRDMLIVISNPKVFKS